MAFYSKLTILATMYDCAMYKYAAWCLFMGQARKNMSTARNKVIVASTCSIFNITYKVQVFRIFFPYFISMPCHLFLTRAATLIPMVNPYFHIEQSMLNYPWEEICMFIKLGFICMLYFDSFSVVSIAIVRKTNFLFACII